MVLAVNDGVSKKQSPLKKSLVKRVDDGTYVTLNLKMQRKTLSIGDRLMEKEGERERERES